MTARCRPHTWRVVAGALVCTRCATGRSTSRIPNAITMQWSRKTLPSMQTTRRSNSPNGRLRNA